MKRLPFILLVQAGLVLAWSFGLAETHLTAQDSKAAGGASVYKSAHYSVTSYAGLESAQDTAALMEELLGRYNGPFLFDLNQRTQPFQIVLYSTKEEFQKAMKERMPSAGYQDFVFLNFADPGASLLAGWKKSDQVNQLAFQGFFQFLWSSIPQPPAWIETGLAYTFWDVQWDGKKLQMGTTLPFLDSVQKLWKVRPLDLEKLLKAAENPDSSLAEGLDYESWALVSFLLQSNDPAYSRVFGNILAHLDPKATAAENAQQALVRLQSLKPLTEIAKDCMDFWAGKNSYSALVAQAADAIKAKAYSQAQTLLTQALAMKSEFSTLYYAGLVQYELKNFVQADQFYAQAEALGSPTPGLLPFARGLAAFGLKKWDQARALLNQAVKENPGEFEKQARPVLDLLK